MKVRGSRARNDCATEISLFGPGTGGTAHLCMFVVEVDVDDVNDALLAVDIVVESSAVI
jgi:hypothetical protein